MIASNLLTPLKSVFGYDAFRPLQREIMEAALGGRDALAILPTGGGKSLCYQLPALQREGLTVVVSPLIEFKGHPLFRAWRAYLNSLHCMGVRKILGGGDSLEMTTRDV